MSSSARRGTSVQMIFLILLNKMINTLVVPLSIVHCNGWSKLALHKKLILEKDVFGLSGPIVILATIT